MVAILAADELATRRDIQDLRTGIREMGLRLIARTDLMGARREARLDHLEGRMTIRLGGMLAAAVALTAALVRLL